MWLLVWRLRSVFPSQHSLVLPSQPPASLMRSGGECTSTRDLPTHVPGRDFYSGGAQGARGLQTHGPGLDTPYQPDKEL